MMEDTMHIVKGELCYSSEPPERYTIGGRGHGNLAGADIQLWNLIYLSLPIVDKYLDPNPDIYELWCKEQIKQMGTVAALVAGPASVALWPEIRISLKKSPGMFLSALQKMEWEKMPPYFLLPHWMANIEARVNRIEFGTKSMAIEAALYQRLGVK
jgi:hypothetical protein